MFQDINVAKSAPFALLTISQKFMYSPKVFKRLPFRQITRNSLTISLFGPRGMETLNFTANCAKFAQFANHHGKPREIRVIITNFYHSLLLSVPQLFTANIAKSAQFANTWCESREINQLRTNFNKSSIFF